MDPAEFGAGAGSHYEYKNIVFQDFCLNRYLDESSNTAHKILLFVLPPAAGFTLPDLKIVYEKRKDRLLVQADRPSGGNRLRRLFHEFQVPEGYQGDKTVAAFQEGNLTLTIPKAPPPASPQIPSLTQTQSESQSLNPIGNTNNVMATS